MREQNIFFPVNPVTGLYEIDFIDEKLRVKAKFAEDVFALMEELFGYHKKSFHKYFSPGRIDSAIKMRKLFSAVIRSVLGEGITLREIAYLLGYAKKAPHSNIINLLYGHEDLMSCNQTVAEGGSYEGYREEFEKLRQQIVRLVVTDYTSLRNKKSRRSMRTVCTIEDVKQKDLLLLVSHTVKELGLGTESQHLLKEKWPMILFSFLVEEKQKTLLPA